MLRVYYLVMLFELMFILASLIFLFLHKNFIMMFTCIGMAVVCHGVMFIQKRKIFKELEEYKKIKVFYLNERNHIWSSHFSGTTSHFWLCQLRRFNWKLPKEKRHVRLFYDYSDRDNLNELSLHAFKEMLALLAEQPSAVIISTSVLNYSDRQPNRINERIGLVKQNPKWQHKSVNRVLSPIESILARMTFGWPVREGERFWKIIAPGVVAWRSEDSEPELKQLGIHNHLYINTDCV